MDMNKTFFLPKESKKPRWRVIDAKGLVLGRLATRLADVLRGKDKAYYTPHTDCGDYIIVVNADKVVLTGDKWQNKIYKWHTGWIGGIKQITAENLAKRHPARVIEFAVRRMLPKNTLNRAVLKKLKVYKGMQHPHGAHQPEQMKLA